MEHTKNLDISFKNQSRNIQNHSGKNMVLGIVILSFYFFSTFFETVPFSILNIDYRTLPLWIKVTYLFIYEIIQLGVIIFLLRHDLKENFLDLKKHHKEYFNKYFKYWFLLLGLMMVSNFLINVLTPNDIARNEEAVRETFEIAPIYMFITSVFIAPFLEELVFRKGIRKICSNNICFILFSGLLFGSLHVVTNFSSYSELLYIIPYSIPGFVFAYLLIKTDNVFVPASMHFMHNGILMSLQMLLLLLG